MREKFINSEQSNIGNELEFEVFCYLSMSIIPIQSDNAPVMEFFRDSNTGEITEDKLIVNFHNKNDKNSFEMAEDFIKSWKILRDIPKNLNDPVNRWALTTIIAAIIGVVAIIHKGDINIELSLPDSQTQQSTIPRLHRDLHQPTEALEATPNIKHELPIGVRIVEV